MATEPDGLGFGFPAGFSRIRPSLTHILAFHSRAPPAHPKAPKKSATIIPVSRSPSSPPLLSSSTTISAFPAASTTTLPRIWAISESSVQIRPSIDATARLARMCRTWELLSSVPVSPMASIDHCEGVERCVGLRLLNRSLDPRNSARGSFVLRNIAGGMISFVRGPGQIPKFASKDRISQEVAPTAFTEAFEIPSDNKSQFPIDASLLSVNQLLESIWRYGMKGVPM